MGKSNSVYIEIRPGTGGEEARLWATDLARMYTRFANGQGWRVFQISDGVIKITGPGVLEKLQNEAGVHRVQRIPETERRGRIHTSTATVAVLPEITEKEVVVSPNDLEWQFFRASTQGGQNVQKVSTAVRVTHKPTGLVAASQEERTQEQNRKIALEHLRAKLGQMQEQLRQEKLEKARAPIGRGMRAEKIRTYNFPQNRVTDHRIGKSWKNLEKVLDGKLGPIITKLQA